MENTINLRDIAEYFGNEIEKCWTRKQLSQLETVFYHFSRVMMDIYFVPGKDDKNRNLIECFQDINRWIIDKRYSL
jgi:hypothetical protein